MDSHTNEPPPVPTATTPNAYDPAADAATRAEVKAPLRPPGNSLLNSPLIKCLGIGLLILVLQVPLWFIDSLAHERQRRRQEAVSDITARWGGTQELLGPILAVPYTYRLCEYEGTGAGRREVTREYADTAFFLPETLTTEASLETETRSRGIHSAAVYTAGVTLRGRFAPPRFDAFSIKPSEVHWDQARVLIGVSDVRGLRAAPAWKWGERTLDWQPGTLWPERSQGLNARVAGLAGVRDSVEFSMHLELNGSTSFAVAPLGKENSIRMNSPWPDPSFTGNWLPEKRSVGPTGFTASWNLSMLSRALPQQWTGEDSNGSARKAELRDSTVGVGLLRPTDAYATHERATKHGILILALVFTAFFLFETLALKGLSGLHYLLVGGALCLFYLALLALSEFMGFAPAYLSAAAASTLLITWHSAAVLRGWKRAGIIAVELAAVYGYLFFVLSMQDYALLAGTLALFAALGAVMWATRRRMS